MQSLFSGLAALKASTSWLDRIANNIANENTTGFAQNTGSFEDMYTALVQGNPTANAETGRYTPAGWRGGTGVLGVGEQLDFTQMPLQQTGVPTDFAIQGDGFFMVSGDNGQPLLTKAGNFGWSKMANGSFALTAPDGRAVLDINGQPITKPAGDGAITVGPDGQISVNGKPGQKLAIAKVSIPAAHLSEIGDNTYAVRPGISAVIVNANGTPQNVSVVQGALLGSNVDATQQMTELIEAQRLYDLNSESVQLTDKMMGIANSITL